MRTLFYFTTLIFILSSCKISYKISARLLDEAKQNPPYDVAIVPGFPFKGDSLGRVLEMRITWAKYLYDNNYVKNFIFSGGAIATEYYECKLMGAYAEAYGIPKENIFYECQAEHSTENLYYGIEVAKKLGFDNIVLATDPYQAKMLKKFNKKYFQIDVLPIAIDTVKKYKVIPQPKIQITEELKKKDFVALKERENFCERLRGTRGKHIEHLITPIKEIEKLKSKEIKKVE